MTIKSWLLLFFIIFSINSIAQEVDTSQASDTSYIETYNQKFSIFSFFSRDYIQLDEDIRPNSPVNFGIGFSIKNTIFKFKYKFPIIKNNENKYGKTDVTDIQIHNYGRKFLFDVFYQSYDGFYLDQRETKILPNLSIQKIGFLVTYIFNGDKFSAKAAFEQDEKQLKSAGSYLLGGGIYYYKIKPDNPEEQKFNSLLFNVSTGYSYSYILSKHWLLTGMVLIGAAFGNETERLKDTKVKIYPNILARGAVGYQQSFWGINLSFIVHKDKLSYSTNKKIELSAIEMQISNIIHFNSFF